MGQFAGQFAGQFVDQPVRFAMDFAGFFSKAILRVRKVALALQKPHININARTWRVYNDVLKFSKTCLTSVGNASVGQIHIGPLGDLGHFFQ